MYGDPEALFSSDEGSLFPLCSNISPEEYLSMEHYGRNNLNSSSSGLLRFRSAPSSFLDNFSSNGNGYAPNSVLYPSSSVIEPINGGLEGGGGYRAPFSIGMNSPQLLRQNSFPAEFFSHPSGFAKMRAGRPFRFGNEAAEHIISPSGIQSPSLGMLSRISETEIGGDGRYSAESFNGPSFNFPENLTGLKSELNTDVYSLFSDSQVGEPRNQANGVLSRQTSLPKTSAEIASMEKLFQYSDPVPIKNIRAKRGCATHPRSIAERVRRTRISERMKKLQELVPNMDKQTNTAGMLDFAVDYIKDLQMQYKILSDDRANCKCSAGKHNLPDRMF